jgi:hypothetical protein
MSNGKGHAVKGALVAGVVGAAAIYGGSLASSRVAFLSSSPYIFPGLLLLGGVLAIAKGKPTLGAALAATGGVIIGMSKAPAPSQASGFSRVSGGDAGMRIAGPRVNAGALGVTNAAPGDAGKMIDEVSMLQD